MHQRTRRAATVLGVTALLGAGATGVVAAQTGTTSSHSSTSFPLVRSAATVGANCLPHATAQVNISSRGPVEVMRVKASGLPKNVDFDLFVIQVPNAPFGLSWYQGDLEADSHGRANGTFVGRFSIETFTVAPGVASAPVVHSGLDASSNPATAPVHQFHLGLWFNSPADAAAAGCLNAVTPFNGDHTAGVQALSTRNFADDQGPLRQVTP
jgi:hypothetical protein